MGQEQRNFNDYYNQLMSNPNKKEFPIESLTHNHKTIVLTFNHECFLNFNKSQIVAFNHKSGNFVTFNFQQEYPNEKIFANNDIFLIIKEAPNI